MSGEYYGVFQLCTIYHTLYCCLSQLMYKSYTTTTPNTTLLGSYLSIFLFQFHSPSLSLSRVFHSSTFWKERPLLVFVPSAAKGQLAKTPEVFSTSIPHPPLLSPALASPSLCNKYHPFPFHVSRCVITALFHIKDTHVSDYKCFVFTVDSTWK